MKFTPFEIFYVALVMSILYISQYFLFVKYFVFTVSKDKKKIVSP